MINQVNNYDKIYDYNSLNNTSVSAKNINTDSANQLLAPVSGQQTGNDRIISTQDKATSDISANTTAEQSTGDSSKYSNSSDNNRRNSSIEDILSSFATGINSYEAGLRGALENSDVISAINGMKKDSILQEYQFFVGNAERSNILTQDEDGLVMRLN